MKVLYYYNLINICSVAKGVYKGDDEMGETETETETRVTWWGNRKEIIREGKKKKGGCE